MNERRAFDVLALAAFALVVTLGLLRIVVVGGSSGTPNAMMPFLIAAGFLCVVGLTAARHGSTAWLALIAALATTTIDLATFGREHRTVIGPDAWGWISILIVLAALASTGAAAAYASGPRRRLRRWVPALGATAVAAVFAVGVWAVATPDPEAVAASPLGDLGLVTRGYLLATLGLTLLGVLGDLRPAADRASRRLAIAGAPRSGLGERTRYARAWLRTVVDELSPGRARAERAVIEERARIARDLHAIVVPDLRRAIREVEGMGSVERLASSLRDALRQVESMMATRDAIGLEVGGLVPALESLAERVEDGSDVRVTIDVVEDGVDEPGSPPPEIAVAALRVATLALDNVVRHAPSASVRVTVTSGAEHVCLSIEDDGPGVPDESEQPAAGSGRRGLADMATEAALCGASLRSGRGERGIGTVIAFDWPGC
jgi:signal transduction histidine kinase